MEECELSAEEKSLVDKWMALPPPDEWYRAVAMDDALEVPGTCLRISRQKYEEEGVRNRCYSCCLSNVSVRAEDGRKYRLWNSRTGMELCSACCDGTATGPQHVLKFVRLNQPDKVVQIQPSLF